MSRSSVRSGLAALLVLAAVLVGTTACSSSDAASSSSGATALDAAAFAERVATEGVVTLDVRTPEEFAQGHLPDAVNIDLESAGFSQQIDALDHAAAYAVYCRSGNRSAQALAIMQDAGFTDVAHLLGGIVAWQAAGGTVVS